MKYATQPLPPKRYRYQQTQPSNLTLECLYISCSAPPYEKRKVQPEKIKRDVLRKIIPDNDNDKYNLSSGKSSCDDLSNSPLLYSSRDNQDQQVPFNNPEEILASFTEQENQKPNNEKNINCAEDPMDDTLNTISLVESKENSVVPDLLSVTCENPEEALVVFDPSTIFPCENVPQSFSNSVSSSPEMANFDQVEIQTTEEKGSLSNFQYQEEQIALPLKSLSNMSNSENSINQVLLINNSMQHSFMHRTYGEMGEIKIIGEVNDHAENKPMKERETSILTSPHVSKEEINYDFHSGQASSDQCCYDKYKAVRRDDTQLNSSTFDNVSKSEGNLHPLESLEESSDKKLLFSPLNQINIPRETKLTNNLSNSLSPLILTQTVAGNHSEFEDKNNSLEYERKAISCDEYLYESNENLEINQKSGTNFEFDEINVKDPLCSSIKVLEYDTCLQEHVSGNCQQPTEFEGCSQESDSNIITFSPLTDAEDNKGALSSQLNESLNVLPSNNDSLSNASLFEEYTNNLNSRPTCNFSLNEETDQGCDESNKKVNSSSSDDTHNMNIDNEKMRLFKELSDELHLKEIGSIKTEYEESENAIDTDIEACDTVETKVEFTANKTSFNVSQNEIESMNCHTNTNTHLYQRQEYNQSTMEVIAEKHQNREDTQIKLEFRNDLLEETNERIKDIEKSDSRCGEELPKLSENKTDFSTQMDVQPITLFTPLRSIKDKNRVPTSDMVVNSRSIEEYHVALPQVLLPNCSNSDQPTLNDKTESCHNNTQTTCHVIDVEIKTSSQTYNSDKTVNEHDISRDIHCPTNRPSDSDNQVGETAVVQIDCPQPPHPPLRSDSCTGNCHQQKDRLADVSDKIDAHSCPAGHNNDETVTEQIVPDRESLLCNCSLDSSELSVNEAPIKMKEEEHQSQHTKYSPRLYSWTPLFASVNDSIQQNDGLYVPGQSNALSSLVTPSFRRRPIRVGLSKRQKVKHLHQHP